MKVLLKSIPLFLLVVCLSLPFTLAHEHEDRGDSTKIQLNSARDLANSIRRIDTLKINHENDPGTYHIEALLAKQFSSISVYLNNNKNNQSVQSYIERFSRNNYRFHLSKMLGLAQYYFPIFERAFIDSGVPLEIKYLAIIESSLNPHAVSRVGATGPWQFMYATAKEHGLTMNSYIDERKDPVAATYAAAEYLKEAYSYYQDWFLAIASYNCGRGNVNKAIKRSGLSNPDYWDIRRFLPRETQNYIPAFIAMHHVLENHKLLGIEPDAPILANHTEEIMVDRQVSLSSIAKALSLEESTILELNPAYKRKLVNGSKGNLQRLIVPQVDKSYYSSLYAALQGNPIPKPPTALVKSGTMQHHSIKKGETLEKIALKYDVTIQDLLAWNTLKNHIIIPGQQLNIKVQEMGSQSSQGKSSQVLTYKVKKGDTLSEIAKRHKISSVETLKAMNDLKSNRLQPGMTLKVKNL